MSSVQSFYSTTSSRQKDEVPESSAGLGAGYKNRRPAGSSDRVNHKSPNFWSIYAAFLFLGIFYNKLFFLPGMLGLRSNKPHKIWAGKANAVACGIMVAIYAAIGFYAYVLIEYGRDYYY